jgi:hypothetical protein
MACSTWMPTIGRAGTDTCSQDADTDKTRSVTSDRSRQIDTGMYVLPSNRHGHLFPSLEEELAERLDIMAREASAAHLPPERRPRRLSAILDTV